MFGADSKCIQTTIFGFQTSTSSQKHGPIGISFNSSCVLWFVSHKRVYIKEPPNWTCEDNICDDRRVQEGTVRQSPIQLKNSFLKWSKVLSTQSSIQAGRSAIVIRPSG
mmetsp:Transcript_2560/g.4507  ORF Transcript_2560/g.4507 Transcript_2560/m.4507 type:complete len:109 (-) Transcript_2560:195-521(-)